MDTIEEQGRASKQYCLDAVKTKAICLTVSKHKKSEITLMYVCPPRPFLNSVLNVLKTSSLIEIDSYVFISLNTKYAVFCRLI